MPKHFSNLPIRSKLVLMFLLTSGLALLLASVSFIAYQRFTYKRDMARDLTITADMIAFNSASALSFDDSGSATETLRGLVAQPHLMAACVYGKDGQVFATYQRDRKPVAFSPPPAAATARFVDGHLDIYRPVILGGETIGTIYLRADLDGLSAQMRSFSLIVGLVMFASILAAYALAHRLQRVISNPMTQLATVAARVATEKDYALRAQKHGDDEIGRLIDGFNEMLAQIQSRDSALGAARANLEKRVEDRTAELANSLALLKRAQKEAAQEQARFKFIFESVPVGISLVEMSGERLHLVNPAHERITGVPAAESSAPGVFERATHPDDYRRQLELAQPFIRGEVDRYSIEKRYVHPDGHVVWALLTSRKFGDRSTGWQQSVTTLVDITERKETEERLAKSLSVLHATLESTTDGILVIDFAGKISNYNQKFAEIWRMPPDVLATGDNQRAIDYVLSQLKDPETFTRKIQSLLTQPEAASFDVLEFADGRVVERHSQPHRVAGETVGRVWSFRDVTERKRAEEELRVAHQQLLDASRQAGMAEVATGVLHNVGNVLNSVNVSATLAADHLRHSKAANLAKVCELLDQNKADVGAFLTSDPKGRIIPAYLGTLAGNLAEERTAVLAELNLLRKNIEHIKDIVAMQQNYARNSGFTETVSLPDLIDDALRMNAGSLARHDVELVRDYQARPVVTTDKHKILQILINLIRNAKYACDDSGRADKRITVRITAGAGTARVAIIDNGIGIPAENLTRIFSHGFTTRQTGHGFGLHSGALAAKEIGGTLTAHSDGPRSGATFTIELPYKPESTPHAEPGV